MNVQKKFEKWSKDERFLHYVNERMREEITDVPENHLLDPQYEELDEGFDGHDEYIEPLVTYLTYKLQLAKLQRNTRKRSDGIWWVFVQVAMQGYYVQVFAKDFDPLLTALQEAIMPMLHGEYVRLLNRKKR